MWEYIYVCVCEYIYIAICGLSTVYLDIWGDGSVVKNWWILEIVWSCEFVILWLYDAVYISLLIWLYVWSCDSLTLCISNIDGSMSVWLGLLHHM